MRFFRLAVSPVVAPQPTSAPRAGLRSDRCGRRSVRAAGRRRPGRSIAAANAQAAESHSVRPAPATSTPGRRGRSCERGRSAASAGWRPWPPSSWPTGSGSGGGRHHAYPARFRASATRSRHPAESLAAELARLWDIPCERLLTRTRSAARQAVAAPGPAPGATPEGPSRLAGAPQPGSSWSTTSTRRERR